MTDEEARTAVRSRFGNEVTEAVELLLHRVVEENEQQNLIARSTIPMMWSRHALDSLQLVDLAKGVHGRWIDIGSGGGFPGLAAAIVYPGEMMLVEPRRRRAEFLQRVAEELGLSARVNVVQSRVERLHEIGMIISARAVASIEMLFAMAHQCSSPATRWLLPRGSFCEKDMMAAKNRWQFMFHVEQSVSSSASSIVVATGVVQR